MTDSLRIGKRALTVAVAAVTILWSVGFSAFVAPMTASAASSGDVIRGTTLSTLYYLASNGQRYAFPNEKTYKSWYADFSGVQTLSDSALAAIPLAGNIVYRPGARWIKIQSDPKTYAVTPQGQIRWIETEAVAVGLAGANWNTFIDDVSDVFFVDYSVGASLASAANGYSGMLVEEAGKNWLLSSNQKREVTSAGFSGNRFQTRHVLSGDGVNLAGMTVGAMVTGAEAGLTDTAQLGAAVTGGLSISLASDTPASTTVPGGADSVEFTKFKLVANSGSATINQIVVSLGGVGATSNIDNVYLYKGSTRLTDGRSVNSTTRKATFTGLNIALAAGDIVYLSVRADTNAAAGGGDTANFSIAASGDVTGTATVSGNFPISGNTMSFSDQNAGTITVSKNATITDPTVGQENAVIGKFKVEAATEDASLKQITLNIDDAGDHSNFKLWKGSTQLATGTSDGELVTFVLTNPLLVAEGDSENLQVSADIGGEKDDDIKVAIEAEADVVAIGGDFGFNMSTVITLYDDEGGACVDGTTTGCSFSEVLGGELTFAFNGPAADDIQIDGDDVVLLKFSITSEEAVEIKTLKVTVACSTGAECDNDNNDEGGLINDVTGADSPDTLNLENITIRKSDGSAWMGPEELSAAGSDATQTLSFTDNQNMTAGQTLDLMVTADVDNVDGLSDDKYRATLELGTAGDVEAEDANGDDLALGDIVPGTDLVGNEMTATNSSLSVQVSTPPSSGTFVKGLQNVAVLGLAFEAGDASDVKVTDLVLNADLDTTVGGGVTSTDLVRDSVNSCSLYDSQSGALIAGPESFDAANEEASFDNFSWTVSAGETEKMIVKCNFANVDSNDADDDEYNFFIDTIGTDITAEDTDGDDVDPTAGAAGLNEAVETVVITITNAGTLIISLDGSTAASNIILGASTGVAMSKFKFEAGDESFLVKELTLDNCVTLVADADGDCADGGEALGADDIASAVKLSYQNEAGATVTKTGFLSGNTMNVSGLDFFIPSGTTRVLTVTIDTNAVSSVGADSGTLIQLNFNAEASGTATFEAVGSGSGETLTEVEIDAANSGEYIVTNDMVVRKTKPTISLASGSPSGASIPGLSEVLRFNVAADSRGFVTLDAVTFKVTTTDGAASGWADCDDASFAVATGWELFDNDDSSDKLDDAADWTFRDGAGANVCGAGVPLKFVELDFEGAATHPAEEIGAGTTKTYVLRVDTTGADSADDDSIRIDIPDEAEIDAVVGMTAIPSAIRWDDDVEGDDINGDLVKNLSVTGGTLVY